MNLNLLNIDIKNNIKEYVSFIPKNKEELQEAVNLWCSKRKKAKKNINNIYHFGIQV